MRRPVLDTVPYLPVVRVDPVKEGYDFLGWTVVFVDGNQPNLSVPPAYIIPQGTTGPVVLIATWKLTYTNTIIEEYGKVHAEFSSFYDITTGQFRRDLFNAYTVESVSEAEHIINNAGQVYSYLLVLYGRFESGSFNAGDDTTVVTVITHMLTQAITDMKATLKIDMTAYNAAYAEFNSYFNTETGQFNRDLFTDYSSESVLEAERIMNFASQIHTYLLAAYGQLGGGHFNAGDDSEVIKTATHILTQAIADMNKALKPLEAPELLVEMYDMGNRIRVWLSYPVEVEHITVVIDGKAAVFDGVLLSGAKVWMPGVGYIEAYSYIDVAKTGNWQSAVLTFMVNGQPLAYELVNDWYMPPTELRTLTGI
ncbi:MAG: hypothetical protein LBH74_06715 [Nitrososphaerota archaeon]|nr:hypothetical protein [Nitrososphaerota archaeon]